MKLLSPDIQPLKMKIELTVIEDLGIKLYSRLPEILSEVVANAWDANASMVEISLQEGNVDSNSTIIVRDDGHGMTYEEIGNKYLRVGRKRRNEEGGKNDGGKKGRHGNKGHRQAVRVRYRKEGRNQNSSQWQTERVSNGCRRYAG